MAMNLFGLLLMAFNGLSSLLQLAFYVLGIVCMVKYLTSRPK